jgi:hypothetical protein
LPDAKDAEVAQKTQKMQERIWVSIPTLNFFFATFAQLSRPLRPVLKITPNPKDKSICSQVS